jgi:hypothetical protein
VELFYLDYLFHHKIKDLNQDNSFFKKGNYDEIFKSFISFIVKNFYFCITLKIVLFFFHQEKKDL